MTGRPSTYSQEIADEVCRRLAGGESLRAICRDEGIPDESTVRLWALDDREGFAAQYARAREVQFLAIADELLEIADDGRNDWMQRRGNDERGGWELNGEHIQRSRVRIDTRKWMLSKMLPKVYGDKTEVAVTGANGGPVQSERVTVPADPIEAAGYIRRLCRGTGDHLSVGDLHRPEEDAGVDCTSTIWIAAILSSTARISANTASSRSRGP